MSALNPAYGHIAKRCLHAARHHFAKPGPHHMDNLTHDAALYEQGGKEMEISIYEMLPVIFTALLALFVIASIRYTVGAVMSTLAMIESPSSTAIIDPKAAPPAYADSPNALSEKEPLISAEADSADAVSEKEPLIPAEADADADVEMTVINNKPITASIKNTIHLLHRTGGFRGRWRGLGLSIAYHALHAVLTNILASLLGFSFIAHAGVYIFVSLGLARLHMLWTHSMIAAPSSTPILRRFVPRQQCRAILLPSLVFAVAQQATLVLPMATAFALKLDRVHHDDLKNAAREQDCKALILMGLRCLAVVAVALFVGLAALLPAAVTLTRIEAALLPEGSATIVPFDRLAILGDIDTTARGGCRQLFVQAWKSVDRSARLRLIKVYVKMVFAQLFVAWVAVHVIVMEMYLVGGERFATLLKSTVAQAKLASVQASG